MDLIQRVPEPPAPILKKLAKRELKPIEPLPVPKVVKKKPVKQTPKKVVKKEVPVKKPVKPAPVKKVVKKTPPKKPAKKSVKPKKKLPVPVVKKETVKTSPRKVVQETSVKKVQKKLPESASEIKPAPETKSTQKTAVTEKKATSARASLTQKPAQQAKTGKIATQIPVIVKATPRYQDNPSPKYPSIARKRGYEGTVILEVLVDEKGKVKKLRILSSSTHNLLDKAAMKSVRRWSFEPATQGSAAVAMWVKVPVSFRLK